MRRDVRPIAVFALCLACLAGLTAACGERLPTGPSVLDVSGTWEGEVSVSTCDTNWIDARSCAHNRLVMRRLVLNQQGDSVFGRFVSLFIVDNQVHAAEDRPVLVTGSVSGQVLNLSGSTTSELRNQEIVENWTTTISSGSDGARLEGAFEHRLIQPGTCLRDRCIDPIVWTRTYQVLGLRRIDTQ